MAGSVPRNNDIFRADDEIGRRRGKVNEKCSRERFAMLLWSWLVSEQRDAIKNIADVVLELEGELDAYLNRTTTARQGHVYRMPEVFDKLRELQIRLQQHFGLAPEKDAKPPSNCVGGEPIAYGAPFDEPFEKW